MKEQHLKNLIHAENPKVGDWWQEMFAPVCLVIEISKLGIITVCEKIKDTDSKHWTWDIEQLSAYTKAQFLQRFRCGRIGNDEFIATAEDNIQNKFWCDVIPEGHLPFIEAMGEPEIQPTN